MSSLKDIEILLQIYLYQRKVVSLPGIGTFKIERIKPKDSESGKYLWGPVHMIRLDSKIDSNDKEIFDFISKKLNITEWEAIKLLNEFVSNLKSTIRKDFKYQLEGLGTIENNEDGSLKLNSAIIQYPFYSRILRPDADLLQSDDDEIMDHNDEESPTEESLPYSYPEEEVKKDKWWVAVIVFLVLSLLIIAISLTRTDIPFGGRQNRTDVQSAPTQFE